MKQHKFTIIIPTRERAETLYWCLKTLVAQDYENLEILVSDNFSQDNTKEVVDSFIDKRIRYINTGKRVDMSSNWEFALSHVTDAESYVGFLGDDDGFLLSAISNINYLLNLFPSEAICWDFAMYNWKGVDSIDSNSLVVPMDTRSFVVSSKGRLKHFYGGEAHVKTIISIYCSGFVKRRIVNEAMKFTGVKFFHSIIPDIYSAVIFSKLINQYIHSYMPFTVAGYSKKSNTGGLISNGIQSSNIQSFLQEYTNLSLHPSLEYCETLHFAYLDGILRAEEQLNGGKLSKKLLYSLIRDMLFLSMRTTQSLDLEKHERNKVALQKIAVKNNQTDYFNTLLKKFGTNHATVPTKTIGYNSLTNTLIFSGDYYQISNIYDTTMFISNLYAQSTPVLQSNTYAHYFRYLTYVMQRLQTYL